MPALARGFTGASDGGARILLFSDAGGSGALRVDQFDIESQKWTRRETIEAGIRQPQAVFAKGHIYLIGLTPDGRHGRTIVYTPKTGAFRVLAPLPTPREHPGIAVGAKDGAIYVFGGRASPCCAGVTGDGGLTVVERFDPATGKWARRAPMPWPDTAPGAASVGGSVYVFLPARVWRYEPGTDQWTPGPTNLSFGVTGHPVVGPDGLIRVFTCTRYDVFDPKENHWQPGLALATARCDPAVVVGNDGQMYVFGGEYSGDPGRVVESANAGGG